MDAELEALIAADEDARARVDAAREAARARIAAAGDDHRRRQTAQRTAEQLAIEEEVRRIDEEAAARVAARRDARARYTEQRRLAAEGLLAEAADLYAHIVKTGAPPRRQP